MKLKVERLDWKYVSLAVILAWAPELSAATTNVSFGSFFFSPNSVTINVGDTVVWNGSFHTVTGTGSDPICGSGIVSGSCSHTFTIPGTYPYQCMLPGHAAAGMTGVVHVVAANNLPPIVSLLSPGDAAVFAAPANITLRASASDPDGSVTNVQFFTNGDLLGAAATSFSFTASNLVPGNYVLTAVAADNGGFSTTSSIVNISVVTPVDMVLTPPVLTNGEVQFAFSANAGLAYVVQHSSDLLNWADGETNVAMDSSVEFRDAFDANAFRFYRVKRLPNP